jgi:hypothetical protein
MQNISLENFSPLNTEKFKWRTNSPPDKSQLLSWMSPVLMQNDQPMIYTGKIGNSKITFSGINLPFHILNSKSYEEIKLFQNIISNLTTNSPQLTTTPQITNLKREQPSQISLITENARGIYFKENYHPGWKAYVNGKKVKIKKAGFGFMHIPIPNKNQQQTQVQILFKGNFLTWSLPTISLLSIILSSFYLLVPNLFFYLKKSIRWHVILPLKSWWKKD